MNILNLLTGTESTGVSITKDNDTLISFSIEGGIRQSEMIFKMIQDALTYTELELKDLDAISTLNGPGSFTGLRVGLACAKSFSFALDIPIIMVDTMEAIYYEAELEGNVLCLMDARRDRVYTKKRYLNREDEVVEIDALEKVEQEVFVVGENILKYKDRLIEKGYIFIPKKDIYLSIKGLTRAALMANKDSYKRADNSEINYLKSKEEIVCQK